MSFSRKESMCGSDSGPSPERACLCETIEASGPPEGKKATKGGTRSADIKGVISQFFPSANHISEMWLQLLLAKDK